MVAEKAGIPILGDIGKAAGGVVKGVGGVVEGTVKGIGGAVEGTVKGIGTGLGKIFGADEEADSKETDTQEADEITVDDDDFGMDY